MGHQLNPDSTTYMCLRVSTLVLLLVFSLSRSMGIMMCDGGPGDVSGAQGCLPTYDESTGLSGTLGKRILISENIAWKPKTWRQLTCLWLWKFNCPTDCMDAQVRGWYLSTPDWEGTRSSIPRNDTTTWIRTSAFTLNTLSHVSMPRI